MEEPRGRRGPSMEGGGISESKRLEIHRCFDEFDAGAKGYLDKDDIKCAVTALLGFRPTKYEVNRLLSCMEGGVQHQGMSRSDFVDEMSRRLALVDSAEEIRQMFCAFDTRCRGFITREDLQQVLSDVCGPADADPAKVAGMFVEADWDGSGRIGYQQFERLVSLRLPVNPLTRRLGEVAGLGPLDSRPRYPVTKLLDVLL